MSFKNFKNINPLYIPTISTNAGGCLIPTSWEEIGINLISCSLKALLIKPGIQLLKSISNLKNYLGWSGQLVLNATDLPEAKNNAYRIRSPYDGNWVHIEKNELTQLILQLAPDFLILPLDLESENLLHEPLLNFFPLLNQANKNQVQGFDCSRYTFYAGKESHPTSYSHEIKIEDSQKIYCIAEEESISQLLHNFNNGLTSSIKSNHKTYIESDLPAQDGMIGRVYSHDSISLSETNYLKSPPHSCNSDHVEAEPNLINVIDLADPINLKPHEVIDKKCQCPTCSSGFTQAYLQHLFFNTPLLCQRFLIQHNAYFLSHLFQPMLFQPIHS